MKLLQSTLFLALLVTAALMATSCLGQKRCCSSPKYSLVMVQKLGQVNQGKGQTYGLKGLFYFDVSQQKQAYNGTVDIGGGRQIHTQTIWDVSKKAMFQINLDAKTCVRINSSMPIISQCIPPSAQYLGSYTTGGSLMVDGWEFSTSSPLQLKTSMFVTRDKCILTSSGQTQKYMQLEQIIATAAFNFTTVVPSNAFDIPSYCMTSHKRQKRSAPPSPPFFVTPFL